MEAGYVRARLVTGWIAAILLILTLACLADGLAAGFKGQTRELHGLPGSNHPLTAPLPPGAESIEDITILGNGGHITLTPDAAYSGFWLGGQMWRGTVHIGPEARPQTRTIILEGPPGAVKPKGFQPLAYTVRVHADLDALHRASPSYLTRLTGQEPFTASTVLFVLALPFIAANFLTARRLERLMNLSGKAAVYMIKRSPEGALISFGLGREHGLLPGMTVTVLDGRQRPSGQARVLSSTARDATARMESGTCPAGGVAMLFPSGQDHA